MSSLSCCSSITIADRFPVHLNSVVVEFRSKGQKHQVLRPGDFFFLNSNNLEMRQEAVDLLILVVTEAQGKCCQAENGQTFKLDNWSDFRNRMLKGDSAFARRVSEAPQDFEQFIWPPLRFRKFLVQHSSWRCVAPDCGFAGSRNEICRKCSSPKPTDLQTCFSCHRDNLDACASYCGYCGIALALAAETQSQISQ